MVTLSTGLKNAAYYNSKHNLDLITLTKPKEEDDVGDGSSLKEIKSEKVDLLINISDGTNVKGEITAGYYFMRRASVDFGVSLITNIKCAIMFAEAMERGHDKIRTKHIKDFYELPTIGWTD